MSPGTRPMPGRLKSRSDEPIISQMSVNLSDPDAGIADALPAENWLGPWETSADPAYCRDLQGRVLAANLSFARKFGKPAATLVGAAVAEFVHPDDVGALQSVVAELARPPHTAVAEHRWLTPQGVRWFAWEKLRFATPPAPSSRSAPSAA